MKPAKQQVFTQISRDFWILNRARKYVLDGVRYSEAKMKSEKDFNDAIMDDVFVFEDN